MSQRTTPRKGGIFDNLVKDLEQDKLKFSITPRKSLSCSRGGEDKENLNYTPSESLGFTQDRDKTFQIDHLKESYGHNYRSRGATLRKSVDMFKEIGEGTSTNNILQAGMKTEKPPINKPGTLLQGNSNKLKMREKLKKLKVTKAELTHIVKEIEVEKMKISELKHSIFNDIRRSFEDFVKNDEIKLKEDMNKCLGMINELQEWELGTEIKLEKCSAIMDDDISSMDEVLKRYENLSVLRHRGKNMDIKLIEREKLDQMDKELKNAKEEMRQAKDNSDKYRQLHETAVQLNYVLTKQMEEQSNQIEKLQTVIDEQKLEEEEQRKRDNELEIRFQRLEKDKEDLKSTMQKDHESVESKYKRELEKIKLNFADELWQLNAFVRRLSANLSHEYQPRSLDQQDIRDDVEMLQLLRQNLSELGKTLDKELDKEKNKLQDSHRDQEKMLGEEYNRYKENLQGKIEKEKEELRESLTLNFKKKTDDLLKEVWSLKSQLQTMVPSEDYKKLEEKLKEKDSLIHQLEEELQVWPKKVGEEVSKKVMEMRKENIDSINQLKEKHEHELTEKANEVKEFYDNLLEDEKQEINQIKEENDFLNQELESANKQIFELMKYKSDFEGSLETERKKLEQRNVENQELVALDFESKFKALQETNLKTIRTYEDRLNKQRMEGERDKAEVRETLQRLQDEYEMKIEELKHKYQEKIDEYREKMQAFNRFREGHEKNVVQISANLKQIKDQLTEKESIIAEKDKEIFSLMNRIEFLEQHESQKAMHSQSFNKDTSFKSTESSRIKQKKLVQQIVQKVGSLGEALGTQSKPVPGTLRTNNMSNTSIDMKPVYQIGKEIEQLTKELDHDISRTFVQDHEHDSLMEDRSLDITHNHPQNDQSKVNISKLSRTLNTSNQSMISNYRNNNTYTYSQDDFKEKSIVYQANKDNKCIQSDFRDDSIFPPFDHRVCLRCKRNDLTSPNYCKYSNLQKLEDLSMHSSKSSVGYKISKSHIYGINVGFKSKIEPSILHETMHQKKSYHVDYSDRGVNTIISNNDFSSQDLSDLRDEDLKELRTPRTDGRWDILE